ncbi:MAG TPA: DUF2076 domain-containing protein [Caulobacteraceae bacterium]|jgi:hypothetical protein
MTPDERALLTRFLSDLAQVRGAAKDPEAAALIDQAVASQPDATYLLVQHSLLADQALHTAQERIADLEAQLRAPVQQPAQSSFLGGAAASPWSQPQSASYQPAYQTAAPPTQGSGFFGGGAPAAPGGFGSFLRNVGTTAAGVAGGEFLFSGLSNLFGGGHSGGFFGGGYGGQPMENVTINNYGDDGDDRGDSGDDWSDDNSGGDFS